MAPPVASPAKSGTLAAISQWGAARGAQQCHGESIVRGWSAENSLEEGGRWR
jgi:hypothetical protein